MFAILHLQQGAAPLVQGCGSGALTCSPVRVLQLVFQVAGFPLLLLPAALGSELGVQRFLSALFAVPPLSKHLGEVESFLWLVPTHSIATETSLLHLIFVWGPYQRFMV